jgi:hypothetical protein
MVYGAVSAFAAGAADNGAQVANSFGASYATYTVVVDSGGNVHYRGGLDSDLVDLHDDAKLLRFKPVLAVRSAKIPSSCSHADGIRLRARSR